MLKPLLKKQLLESLAFFAISNKDGKRRSTASIVGFVALMVYALGAMVVLFYQTAKMLCAPLVAAKLDWVYFAFMGAIAFALAFIGSVFSVKAKVYEAKDNELLLSMPVKPWHILFSRTVGAYAYAWLFAALVFAPALVCYFTVAGFSFSALVGSLLSICLLPLGALALGFLFGWILAIVTARLPAKNLLTTVFFLAFFVAYMFLYSKLNDYLAYVIGNGAAVGAKMKTALYPFYQLGLGSTGNWSGMGLSVVVFCGAFALAYLVVARSFLKIAIAKRGGAKAKYTGNGYRQRSAFSALFRREAMRLKNPMVLLNAAMGVFLALLLPVFALFNLDVYRQLVLIDGGELLVAAIVCVVGATNVLSASAVSLEGENLWRSQTLPVATEKILAAKICLHTLLSGGASLVCGVTLGVCLRLPALSVVMTAATVCAFALFSATLGLAINLKLPDLHWTSEVAAVKQGMSPLAAMFANIATVAALVGGYFLFGKYMPPAGYLAVCFGALGLASGMLMIWLGKRGCKIFERL